MQAKEFIAEINDFLDDGEMGQGQEASSRRYARAVKKQIKYAEQHGGFDKVFVGIITGKAANIANSRVVLTVEETTWTPKSSGTETHEAYMQAKNSLEAADMLLKMRGVGGYVAVDRETNAVVALFGV